jgi:hypothetical protein
MIDVNIKYELYDYVLFENDQRVKDVFRLTLYEAKQKNYAFRLNRVNKLYKLKSELDKYQDNKSTIVVLPKDR